MISPLRAGQYDANAAAKAARVMMNHFIPASDYRQQRFAPSGKEKRRDAPRRSSMDVDAPLFLNLRQLLGGGGCWFLQVHDELHRLFPREFLFEQSFE